MLIHKCTFGWLYTDRLFGWLFSFRLSSFNLIQDSCTLASFGRCTLTDFCCALTDFAWLSPFGFDN